MPGGDLCGGDFPQIVDLGRLASDSARGNLGGSAQDILGNKRIGSRRRLDTNDSDPRVIL